VLQLLSLQRVWRRAAPRIGVATAEGRRDLLPCPNNILCRHDTDSHAALQSCKPQTRVQRLRPAAHRVMHTDVNINMHMHAELLT
jgi:hypothetical protein